MTIRNLDKVFQARSVVLIGASSARGSVGRVLVQNLKRSGFDGPVFYVNPKYTNICGEKCYQDLKSLPMFPDLAIIATPPQDIPDMIAELGAGGTRGAVVISAGFEEQDGERNKIWKQEIQKAAQPYLLRIVGPNCLGVMVPKIALNASFSQTTPLPGGLAFVAQSGAVLTTVLEWATERDIGFTHFVSLGDILDVDFGDVLDYLAADGSTRAILLYIEAITDARKFMSAARTAARLKPVIVVKAGRFEEGARAAASHSGALAGVDAIYDAAFRRAGVVRVMDMEALFNAVETLALVKPVRGNRLAILTNGGGVGVMATDTLIEKNGRLAELSEDTLAKLDEVLPPMWSKINPIDIIGDAEGPRYEKAMSILLEDRDIDGILVMNCPTAITSSTEAAKAVIRAIENHRNIYRNPAILAAWMGNGSARESRRMFRRNGIPCYETPGEGVRGFMQMVRYQHNREMMLQTVNDLSEDFSPDRAGAQKIVGSVLADGRSWLNTEETKAIMTGYGIPFVPSFFVETADEAAAVAGEIHGRVTLKIESPDILHKSEMGCVELGLDSAEEVRLAARRMIRKIAGKRPDATVHGFIVQQMVDSHNAREIIIGAFEDSQFGPVLLFGHGGTAVEIIRDRAFALPPLNLNLAYDLMNNTRVMRLLEGYRDVPAADLEAIAMTLVKVSQLVCDIGEIKELDVNPLIVDEKGVVVVDCRIYIQATTGRPADRLAICPYPVELEELLSLPDGQKLLLRPVKPQDERKFIALFDRLTPQEIQMRFLHPMKTLSHDLAARLTQIDYDREMAFVLVGVGKGSDSELFGGVRITCDPDRTEAEFAILLIQTMTGLGLGPMLLRKIIDYAKRTGVKKLFGEVLVQNSQMLKLARALGFSIEPLPGDASVRLVQLELNAQKTPDIANNR